MRIWLFAAKRGLLVHKKIVLLLSTSMAGSALMAGTLQHSPKLALAERAAEGPQSPCARMALLLLVLARARYF